MTMTVTEVEDELPPVGDSACPTGLAFGDSDDSFGVPTRGSKKKLRGVQKLTSNIRVFP